MCMHLDALLQFVVKADGFEFVEEGPNKKKGFVGLKPGRCVQDVSVSRYHVFQS